MEEITRVISSRQAVLRTIGDWIHNGGGALDALDDIELFSAIKSFLSFKEDREYDHPNDNSTPTSVNESDGLASLWKDVESARAELLQTFTRQTMRPLIKHVPVRSSLEGNAAHGFGVRPPKVEELIPEDLVDNLDAMVAAAFRNVAQEVY